VLAAPATAATITVTSNVDETLDPGFPSTPDGECSLREAIQAANTDAVVEACPAGSGADAVFIPSGFYIKLISLEGNDNNQWGDLDIATPMTILGAGPLNTAIRGNNDRIFHVLPGANPVRITGVRIERGGTSTEGGGGILNQGTLQLTNALVTNNKIATASGGINHFGGGIRNSGTLTISNSTISGNSASETQTTGGGGVGQSGPGNSLTIQNSVISGNRAYVGGGVYDQGGNVRITGSVVTGNAAATLNAGGGLLLESGGSSTVYTVSNTTITDNRATDGAGLTLLAFNGGSLSGLTVARNQANSSSGNGGGAWIRQLGGTVTLANSSFSLNRASSGGALFFDGGPATVTGTTANANHATNGGGIYSESSGLAVVNSTISGNTASAQGGGLVSGGVTSLRNTTINANSAPAGGNLQNNATINLKNTIVGDAASGPNCGGTGAWGNQGGNLESNAAPPTTCIEIPQGSVSLGPLQNNGGPTLTHALLPAADPDAINNAADCEGMTDQRGVPRNLGGACDSGAYERVTCAGGVVDRVGTQSADRMNGTNANEVFLMLGGNDVLNPGGGTDRACMGVGNDTVRARDGKRDFLRGEGGTRDRLVTRDSNDSFTGFERFG
jgi:CSLREA domain-containing protein